MKFELLPDNRGADDSTLLDDVRKVAHSLGTDSVTRDDYDRLGRFHNKTLVNRFGSWNRALELAGLAINRNTKLSRQDCLLDLQRVAAILSKTAITVVEYRVHGKYSEPPIRRLFGSWTAALLEAGLSVSENYRVRPSDTDMFENMERVWRALGRQPSSTDFREPLSQISAKSYTNRFGSWRASLEAFVAFVSEEKAEADDFDESVPVLVDSPQPRRSSRTVSWRLRFLVMRRDRFLCRTCGAAPGPTRINMPGFTVFSAL